MKIFSAFMITVLAFCSATFALAQSDGRGAPGYLEQKLTIDAIFPEEQRLVIDDQELFVRDTITMNNQSVSGAALLQIVREGQAIDSFSSERSGPDSRLYLIELETL